MEEKEKKEIEREGKRERARDGVREKGGGGLLLDAGRRPCCLYLEEKRTPWSVRREDFACPLARAPLSA